MNINISHVILKISSKICRRHFRSFLWIILFIALIDTSASVNKIDFRSITSNSGLSSEEIRAIIQDSEGFMWFLTPEGLNRYDGYDFRVYKKNADDFGFPTSSFECVCEDSQNRIWLGTEDHGIVIFDTPTNKILPFEELTNNSLLPEKRIRSLMYDSQNRIWIGTEYGLYRYDISGDQLDFYNLAALESETPEWCIIEDILEDDKGNIWIATWNEGLFVYDNSTFKNFRHFDADKSSDQNNQIKSLYQDSFGFIWVGTWEDGLYKTVYEKGTVLINATFLFSEADEKSIAGNIIYSINQDINNNIWIGTPYGLSIIENAHTSNKVFHRFKYTYGTSQGLSNNEIWKIFRDKSGMMWLGTLEGGINFAHPDGQVFESFTIPPVSQQIHSQTTQSFIQDPRDRLLVGIRSLGFGYYDLANKRYTHYTDIPRFNSLPGDINTVNCFLKVGKKLWMGTRYNGVGVYDYSSRDFRLLSEFSISYDIRVLHMAKDSSIWAGTVDGLYRITIVKDEIDVQIIDAFSNQRITSICEDVNDMLWIGTAENGICKLAGGGAGEFIPTFFSGAGNLVSDEITAIHCGGKGSLWVGTNDKGMLRCNVQNGRIESSTSLQGLSNLSIMGIIEDSQGKLWVTTNNGIARITQSGEDLKSDNYTLAYGLQGNRFVQNSIYKLDDDRILMGGYYGFNAFYASNVKENTYLPPTVLTSVTINNEVFDFRKNERRVFRHDESTIGFAFSCLSYYKSEKNIFSYKLEGLDQDWTPANAAQRDVRYSILPPGDYTFLLRSANSSELWNEEAISFEFVVKPAPTKTWWAFTIYLLVFLSIVFLMFRYQLRRQKIIRDLEIEKIQHEKTEKLNDYKLRFFTNISHEILTPLSVILGAVGILKRKTRKGQDEIQIMERNLLGLKQLLRQLLDFRKMESGHLELKVREGNLVEVIQSIISNFKPLYQSKKISFSYEHPEELVTCFDEDKINKIFQNLISNAIKYTPENGKVWVKISKDQEHIILSIEDTGHGISEKEIEGIFNRFYRADVAKRESGTGIGLALVNNLVTLHKGSIDVSSTVGKGTAFTIHLPLEKGAYSELEFEEDKLDKLKEEELETEVIPMKNTSILLVEDNADFRSILKSHLETFATIIESPDGDDALRKAIKYSPSIVVSDVMMPTMNGFELCVQLKSNVDTEHIPVILLTAKTADLDREKGYDCGADSYISKPVSLSVLRTRIFSLLQKQRSKTSLPEGLLISRAPNEAISDEVFLEKLQEFVNENVSKIDFKVPDMHQPFGMSSSAFFRKVKQLTKLSPVEYVKKTRLNRAALLLSKKELTISEIAFNTGFSDQSYFGACFKKQFGMTPTEYIENKG